METPEIDPYKYTILTFDKGAKPIPWRKDNFSIIYAVYP